MTRESKGNNLKRQAATMVAEMLANDLLMRFVYERLAAGQEMEAAIAGGLQDEYAVILRNLERIAETGYRAGRTDRAKALRLSVAHATYDAIRPSPQGSKS